jgi:hypothetical protein
MTIKSFRGLLADGGQDKIRVAGGKLEDGYKIVKLQVIGSRPGALNFEAVVQVWKTPQKIITADIDFTNPELLAVATWSSSVNDEVYPADTAVIFDNEIINQDIYITNQDLQDQQVNYYLELEQIKMSGPEAAAVNFRAALVHGGPNDP